MTGLMLTALLTLAVDPSPRDPPTAAPPTFPEIQADWKPIGRSLWFDPRGKQLVIKTRVVLREGPLEHLLCLKGTKEHEAILATDAQPRQIHAGLLLTGAEAGHPVRFVPKFEPPAGTPIAIELVWKADGKTSRADARRWVKDEKAKKPLSEGWVFAGSELFQDEVTKRVIYAADEGDLITVANFGSAILDLPLVSPASDADRVFTADTPRIPPLGTEVLMFLRKGEAGKGPKKP